MNGKKVTYLTFLDQVTASWITDPPSADSEVDEDVVITEYFSANERSIQIQSYISKDLQKHYGAYTSEKIRSRTSFAIRQQLIPLKYRKLWYSDN
ncbi:hypothetical protein V1478_004394 [Vespula squamosa]|uniref:Uncharacterized protein n=1 Tax=Vespula squamosa TaxID=30214 RepID=A0ABD2BH51_VESSQ